MLPVEIIAGLKNPASKKAPTVIGTMKAKIILAFFAFFICIRYVRVICSTNRATTYPIRYANEYWHLWSSLSS